MQPSRKRVRARLVAATRWRSATTGHPSREVIADSVETCLRAHAFDGLLCIPNCDKIVPGMLMGAVRVDLPTVFVSGGPMPASAG